MSDDEADGCCGCGRAFRDNETVLSCSECGSSFHLGDCSGVAETTFKSKGESYKKAWRCPACKPGRTKGSQPVKLDVASLLADINRKLDSLIPLKATVDSIERKIQEVSDKYDEVLKSQVQHDKEIKELNKRMEAVEKVSEANEIDRLRQEVNNLEWQSRKLNLEVHGITRTENESLLDKINQVASRLQLPPLSESDIVALHRLPAKPDNVPGVIVRFTRQATREQWLNNRKKLLGTEPKVFIVENMTKQNRALFLAAKEWAKRTGFRYVWHRNGSVLVRKQDRERAIVVRSEDDLLRLE